MIVTLNQVVKTFKDWSIAQQPLLNSFGYGPVAEFGTSVQMQYPAMWLSLQPGNSSITIANSTLIPNISFTALFVDQINIQDNFNEDNGNLSDNRADIMSDTLQLAQDFLRDIQATYSKLGIVLTGEGSLNPVEDETPDKVCGWMLDFTLKMAYSTCSPSNVAPTATYKNSNGTYTVKIEAGKVFTAPDIQIQTAVDLLTFPANVAIDLSDYSINQPATVHNSDDTFTLSVNPGADVELEDISITTGSGLITSPSNIDIDLSTYYQIINPTGTRVPNLIPITDPNTQTAWINISSNVTPSVGKIMKKQSADQAFDSTGGFLIPTMGDFEVEFKIDTNNSSAGISFYDSGLGYNDIDFSFYQDNNAYAIYEKNTRKAVGASTLNSLYKVRREGQAINYYVDGVKVYGSELLSPPNLEGYMVFDTSLFTPSTSITNILLRYL